MLSLLSTKKKTSSFWNSKSFRKLLSKVCPYSSIIYLILIWIFRCHRIFLPVHLIDCTDADGCDEAWWQPFWGWSHKINLKSNPKSVAGILNFSEDRLMALPSIRSTIPFHIPCDAIRFDFAPFQNASTHAHPQQMANCCHVLELEKWKLKPVHGCDFYRRRYY